MLKNIFGSPLSLGTVFSIPVYMHWSLALFIAMQVFAAGVQGLLFSIALFASVFLHELGHAVGAKYFNLQTKSITLHFFGGLATIEASFSHKPFQEFVISIFGPLVNVAIFAVCGLLSALCPHHFLYEMMVINFVMCVFNMLPVFPMDGGRVMRSILSAKYGKLKSTRISVKVAYFVCLVGACTALYFQQYSLLILCALISLAAKAELANAEQK